MARADLYAEEFDILIQQKGIECHYYPAIVCQCITEDSGQPHYSCPYCGGSGFRYLPYKTSRVVVTSLSGRALLDTLGLKESGTVYATPPSNLIMGFHDRLIFPKFKCKFSERIIFSGNLSTETYRNIVEVDSLLIDDKVLEVGKDFKISEDAYHLELLKPLSELLGVMEDRVSASLLYYTNPSYLVADLLHELRATYTERNVPKETYKELPKQYKLVREDFTYHQQNQGDDVNE